MSARSEIPTIKHPKLPPIKYQTSHIPTESWKRHLNERAAAESRQRVEDAILAEITLSELFV